MYAKLSLGAPLWDLIEIVWAEWQTSMSFLLRPEGAKVPKCLSSKSFPHDIGHVGGRNDRLSHSVWGPGYIKLKTFDFSYLLQDLILQEEFHGQGSLSQQLITWRLTLIMGKGTQGQHLSRDSGTACHLLFCGLLSGRSIYLSFYLYLSIYHLSKF